MTSQIVRRGFQSLVELGAQVLAVVGHADIGVDVAAADADVAAAAAAVDVADVVAAVDVDFADVAADETPVDGD